MSEEGRVKSWNGDERGEGKGEKNLPLSSFL